MKTNQTNIEDFDFSAYKTEMKKAEEAYLRNDMMGYAELRGSISGMTGDGMPIPISEYQKVRENARFSAYKTVERVLQDVLSEVQVVGLDVEIQRQYPGEEGLLIRECIRALRPDCRWLD